MSQTRLTQSVRFRIKGSECIKGTITVMWLAMRCGAVLNTDIHVAMELTCGPLALSGTCFRSLSVEWLHLVVSHRNSTFFTCRSALRNNMEISSFRSVYIEVWNCIHAHIHIYTRGHLIQSCFLNNVKSFMSCRAGHISGSFNKVVLVFVLVSTRHLIKGLVAGLSVSPSFRSAGHILSISPASCHPGAAKLNQRLKPEPRPKLHQQK